MSITSQMTDFLNREGAATPEDIAATIPELNQCGGAERALFLLRLNPQFERIDKDSFSSSKPCVIFMVKEDDTSYLVSSKWTTRGSGKTDKDTVQEATLQYFKSLGRQGATIANVVIGVTKATGLDAFKVKQILLEQFITKNTNIFNRPKRQEDK